MTHTSIENKNTKYNNLSKSILILVTFLFTAFLASCASEVNRHGHVFTEDDIKQIRKGMSKDQVKLALGSPTTKSAVDGEVFYYISSTQRHVAFFKPSVVERKVVVVYFDARSEVRQIAQYGLKDGKVFDFISRTTPSHAKTDNVLESLLKGIGRPSAGF